MFLNGVLLRDFTADDPDPWVRVKQVYEVTRFGEVAGRPTALTYTILDTFQQKSKAVELGKHEVELSDVVVVSEFSTNPFVITSNIPNGTSVTAEDDDTIRYVWQDGEVVKSVNTEGVAGLKGLQFVRGPFWSRVGIVVAVLTVFVLTGRLESGLSLAGVRSLPS